MKLMFRALILGFLSITLISYFLGGQVSQQAALVNYHKEAEAARTEQEQRACHQFMNSKMCTAPRDRFTRILCSEKLSDFHCEKYADVGYLILDEHKTDSNRLQE